jgi:formylglycine-generating enzyme required for sulfatase activity
LYPATVSDFRLDKYEVTVGRFRQFVAAVEAGWRPTLGEGRHTHLNGGMGLVNSGRVGGFEAGWDAAWTASLPTTAAAWTTALSCNPTYQTWTSAPGRDEGKALNCLSLYAAQAFCLWDGGFLPSEAEWNYAASGGSEQRVYPWSSPPRSTRFDATRAVAGIGVTGRVALVGSTPAGNGLYGHSDLSGNLAEWALDGWASPYEAGACSDCSNLLPASSSGVIRGGDFYDIAFEWLASSRLNFLSASRYFVVGARCARAP